MNKISKTGIVSILLLVDLQL